MLSVNTKLVDLSGLSYVNGRFFDEVLAVTRQPHLPQRVVEESSRVISGDLMDRLTVNAAGVVTELRLRSSPGRCARCEKRVMSYAP